MSTSPLIVTDAQRQSLHEQGFFITERLFDDATLAALKNDFKASWDEVIASAGEDELQQWMARVRPFLANLHTRPACARFLKSDPMLALASQLIGPDVDVCYNQAVIKAPSTGKRPNTFAWHQDSAYAVRGTEWDRDIMIDLNRTFQGWVAVTDTTIENGTLRVLPGRHREGILEYEQLPDTNELSAIIDTSASIPVELKAGQMLVFSGLLPHASTENTSSELRQVYQFCYAVPGARQSPHVFPVLRNGQRVQ